MTTRALRGWTLGNPIGITERRESPYLMCECSYTSPYLHSLIVQWFHWDKGVLRIPQEIEQAKKWVKDYHDFAYARTKQREGPYVRTSGSLPRHYTEPPEPLIFTEAGFWHWSVFDHPAGGFFSYKPSHINRMGRWDEVRVIGVVTLFGDIVVHERGYRSEGLRMEHLWVLNEASHRFPKSRLKDFLESTYQCDVTILRKKLYDGFYDWLTREDVENLL